MGEKGGGSQTHAFHERLRALKLAFTPSATLLETWTLPSESEAASKPRLHFHGLSCHTVGESHLGKPSTKYIAIK